MQGFAVGSGDESVVNEQRGGEEYPRGASREGDVPSRTSAELLAEVRRLEHELERYRAHAERTSKLFLSATKYADWVRENARRDAELALRKASARAERLELAARDLEWTEAELARKREELVRLGTLTDETRARLTSFLNAGLQVLGTDAGADGEGGKPGYELPETVHGQLAPMPVATSGRTGEHGTQER